LFAYGGLFAIGSLAGLLGTYLLSRTPEPDYQPAITPLFSLIKLPFRHANFRQLMTYTASWNFAVNLATPFFTVYMLEKLGLSMTYVIALTTLTQVFNVFFFRRWGRYADRYSNKTVLGICAPLYLLCIVGMVFTTLPGPHAGTLPLLVLLHALMGVATAGTGLASGNIGLKLAPDTHSVAYLSMLSFTNSLAAGIAPILSGWLSGYLVATTWTWEVTGSLPNGGSWSLISLQHWDFLFLLSSATGAGALYWLGRLQEAGDASRRVLIRRWQKEVWLWGDPKLRIRVRKVRALSTLTVGPSASPTGPAAQTPSQSHPQKRFEAH
jgi:MFS family permease